MSSYTEKLRSLKQPKISNYFKPQETSKGQRKLLSGRKDSFILELPNELFLLILEHLLWEDDYYDIIRQLYLVCKRFCRLFAPLVFQSFRIFDEIDRNFARRRLIWGRVTSTNSRARIK
jgi:hypothetical protein